MGTPSHLGHMDRVAATMPSQAHAGAAQEAPDIGQWEGQDVPLVRPSSCNVKGGILSSRRYLPTYLPPTGTNTEMARSAKRQYTSAQRTSRPSRSPTSVKTTHTSNTYPPKPEPHRTPDWVPEDAPYTSHDRAYHYPNPIQHLARVLGDTGSRAHIQELQEKLQVPLYHSALHPANVPADLQKRRIQLLKEQLPFLTRVARWLARKHIHVPEEHIRCPCDHTNPEDWEHFRKCPLHTGRDTLVGWSPAETLRQHKGWPTHSHAHQATEHLFRDLLVKEATMRRAVTQFLHRHLAKHTESPIEAAAHLQLEAVCRAAAQMVHPKHLLLTHTEQLTDPTARERMQRLFHYHAVHDPVVH